MLEDIAAHAREALPTECCGLLVGTATGILASVRSANIADDPAHRFQIDPKAHIDARRDARARALSVVGFYHSHPSSEPLPSATDLELATYDDHWYLIVRPLAVGCEARLFRLAGRVFVEEDTTA